VSCHFLCTHSSTPRGYYCHTKVPERIGIYFHPGAHPMNDLPSEHDWIAVSDFADLVQRGIAPANASLFNTLAYPVTRPYSWGSPGTPP
jgi:hypothetical protein